MLFVLNNMVNYGNHLRFRNKILYSNVYLICVCICVCGKKLRLYEKVEGSIPV